MTDSKTAERKKLSVNEPALHEAFAPYWERLGPYYYGPDKDRHLDALRIAIRTYIEAQPTD